MTKKTENEIIKLKLLLKSLENLSIYTIINKLGEKKRGFFNQNKDRVFVR